MWHTNVERCIIAYTAMQSKSYYSDDDDDDILLYPRKRSLKGIYWNQSVGRSVGQLVGRSVGLSAKSVPLYSSFSVYLIYLILGINVNQE